MNDDLQRQFPVLFPKACAWAERYSRRVLATGAPLPSNGLAIATRMGVAHPDRIRIVLVGAIPSPDDPELIAACAATGFLGPATSGLTLGYGIYLRSVGPALNTHVLAHEARHVFQYEQAGSIESFLAKYLLQVLQFGHAHAPLELDARTAAEAYA